MSAAIMTNHVLWRCTCQCQWATLLFSAARCSSTLKRNSQSTLIAKGPRHRLHLAAAQQGVPGSEGINVVGMREKEQVSPALPHMFCCFVGALFVL